MQLNITKKQKKGDGKRRDFRRYKMFLAHYLMHKGIDIRKPFRCINPQHEDNHPSMKFWHGDDRVHCFTCNKSYDIYDVIQILEPGIDNIKDAYDFAERTFLFPDAYDDDNS